MSDVVETRVNNHIFDVSVKPNNRNAQAQEQEVKDCTEFLKIEYTKFRKYKILLDCIEECIEDDNNLDSELRTKIKKIILGEQVSQTRLSDNPIEDTFETILGVPLGSTELTFSESNNLHSCLKSKLDSKSANLKSEFFKDTTDTSVKSESPLDLAQNDATLLDYRNQLVTEQETYMKNQIDMLELLEELKDIRLKTVPEVTNNKYQECHFRSRINHLKSQLASNKCKIDIFVETSDSLKAYTEVLKDLKEQQEESTMEIERLKHLKKKYSEVSCKEYEDILKSYLQYKSALAKKKLRFELCE